MNRSMQTLRAFLLPLVLCVFALSASTTDATAQAGTPEASAPAAQAPAAVKEDKSIGKIFKDMYRHNVPYPVWPRPVYEDGKSYAAGDKPVPAPWYAIYNVNVSQWIALALMLLLFLPVRAGLMSGKRGGWVTRVFRGWVLWLRDEMIYPIMGEETGRKFAPFFIFTFFFVMFMNVLGLIPNLFFFGSYTPTSTPYVTGALALVIFICMLFFGMREQGAVKFWVNLLPHGLPVFLIPIMVVVELVALFVKPFALMVRLFANMLAGHLVIASVIGLVFVFARLMDFSAMSYVTAVPALGMAIFVNTLEAFITLLQAYIFTYLSVIFVQAAMHPEH